MYLQFFGFREPPFNLTPDSKFLFLSHRHQEALAALLFGVQERKGFICLTGEIGCGKTTLCRAMLSQLDQQRVRVCVVLNSYLTDLELLKTINEGYGLPSESDSKKALLDRLNEFLVSEFSNGNNVVLIIDEAQNLRPDTLEQIRMISNLETETAKLIQIVLVGQPELRRTLALPELEQLNQRITVRYHITPLEEREVPDYIRHRMAVAEPQVEITFSDQAYRLVHHYSRGVPRRINVIVDRCLLVAYVQGTFSIDDKVVQQAVDEVRGETGGFSGGPDPLLGGIGPARRTIPNWAMATALGLAAVVIIVVSIFLGQLLVQKTMSQQFAQAP
ncbi:MAG TPA: AAA family ATPase, partial [Candidatus Sumerlaeota bacterium]|nr:AAA family ATPase [Candidatus Sumerlaeota bacterium]